MTDLERAQRDADKVLSFIKFQTVRTKPAEVPDKPRKPAAPPSPPPRPAALVRHADTATGVVPAAAEPAVAPAAQVGASTLPVVDPATPPLAEPPASFGPPAATPAPTMPAAEPQAEPDAAEPDEVPLQLQRFVAPVLPPSVQATLVGGSRKVTVRFTVEPNGTVSKAEAAADVPRRLVRPATEAILQWQFAPLPQARTVDVEIAFKRESTG
jgi:hypothetical protein